MGWRPVPRLCEPVSRRGARREPEAGNPCLLAVCPLVSGIPVLKSSGMVLITAFLALSRSRTSVCTRVFKLNYL